METSTCDSLVAARYHKIDSVRKMEIRGASHRFPEVFFQVLSKDVVASYSEIVRDSVCWKTLLRPN